MTSRPRTSNTSNGNANGNNPAEGQAQSLVPPASQARPSAASRTSNRSNGTRPSPEPGASTTSTAPGNDSNGASGKAFILEQLAAQAAAARENNGEARLTEQELFDARRREIDRVKGLGPNEDKDLFEQYCVETKEELRDAKGAISLLVHSDKQLDEEWKIKATQTQQSKVTNHILRAEVLIIT